MQVKQKLDLSLVLPLYNEGPVLQSNLNLILTTLESSRYSFEIILIDDGSCDQTPATAAAFAREHADKASFFQHENNVGRGGTVMDGFRRARGEVVGFIDVDCEVPPFFLLNFLPDLLARKKDVITGLRVYPFSFATMLRAATSITYRWLTRIILKTGFVDDQTGYKFFRHDSLTPLMPLIRHRDWFWDTEIMVVARLAERKIEERPVLFLRNLAKRSTVSLLRDGLILFRQLFAYRRRLPQLKRELLNTALLREDEPVADRIRPELYG